MEPLVIRFEIGMSESLAKVLANIAGTLAAAQVMGKAIEAPTPKEEPAKAEKPAAAAPAAPAKAEAKAAPAKPSAVKDIPDDELTAAVDRAKARGITSTRLRGLLAERGYARVLACPQDQREDFIMTIDNL